MQLFIQICNHAGLQPSSGRPAVTVYLSVHVNTAAIDQSASRPWFKS